MSINSTVFWKSRLRWQSRRRILRLRASVCQSATRLTTKLRCGVLELLLHIPQGSLPHWSVIRGYHCHEEGLRRCFSTMFSCNSEPLPINVRLPPQALKVITKTVNVLIGTDIFSSCCSLLLAIKVASLFCSKRKKTKSWEIQRHNIQHNEHCVDFLGSLGNSRCSVRYKTCPALQF